jgi:RNA polymerase sigma factor (sigma-70 family)
MGVLVSISDPPGQRHGEVFFTRRSDLRAIAYRIVGQADLVEDVLQDAYVKLLEGACCREVLNPFGYCCQVVRNTAIDYCRRRVGVVEAHVIMQSPDGELPEVAGEHLPDAGIDERRLLERIDEILATLPERTRLVFEMYRLHGKTQREIAKVFDVSPTLVNFMIRDVMNALASCRDAFDEEE